MRSTIAIITAILITAGSLAFGLASASDITAAAGGPIPESTPGQKTVRDITFIDGEFDGIAFTRADDEWKKTLSEFEFYILRKEGTEKPYSGSLLKNKKKGSYHCAACGLAVFSSTHKYDSQTGWPSFYKPIYKKNVTEKADRSLPEEERIEIECARCGGHLGHVFDDGPEPTGLRYCINSAALRFKAEKK